MELPGYTAVTALDRGDMLELSDEVSLAVWPEFMLNDPVANEHWSDLYLRFPGLQFGLVEARSGDFAAFGNCIPHSWDGDLRELSAQGWDWAHERGFQDLEAGRDPNLVCALQVTVRREFRGRGASGLALRQMVEFTRELGCEGLIAPVRPTWNSMAFSRVRCRGGGYLYALAHRGERVTLPSTACKRRSSTLMTAPSIS